MKKVLVFAIAIMVLSVSTLFAGNLVISGSTTVLPISQEAIEVFMKMHPDVKINLSGGGSSNGIKALLDGTTDIANASRFIKDKEVKLGCEKGVYPVPYACAYDAILPIVHPSNRISGLTIDQLRAIYEGKITNFKDIGGDDLRIAVVSRDTSSGTYETWEGKVMSDARVFPGAQLLASNGAVVTAVAKNKNAIGYIGIGYLNKEVKAITVNGIEGTKANALSGTYPIARALYMFTNGWPEGDTLSFIQFLLSPEGQKLVDKVGYVGMY